MEQAKEKDNDGQRIDLQGSREENAEKRGKDTRTAVKKTQPNNRKSKETRQEVTNNFIDDMNSGNIGAQDYNINNATGFYAGLWESKRIQLDSSTITPRARNIINVNKNRRNKMTDSGQPRDTINVNPTLVIRPNFNPTSISHGA